MAWTILTRNERQSDACCDTAPDSIIWAACGTSRKRWRADFLPSGWMPCNILSPQGSPNA
jgi:hypothetical protein